ncbi:MAG: response regulator transcription factor [Deltaproteobacteria bacterium]|nr:response regulator transcription factor [Deltaproteobacteria bacterium]
MPPTRVLLVDDHPVVRAGIRTLLEQMDEVQVVGEADTGRDALKLLKSQSSDVDVVLMDVSMTDLNGIATTGYITKDYPHPRVLILSMHTDEPYVLAAVQAGVAGYIPKSATREELELALRTVARGETYLSPSVAKHVVGGYRRLSGQQTPEQTKAPAVVLLRPHERELLQLISEGHATKEIAARLHISPKAVESRRIRLMERLDIHDLAGLVRYALRTGIIPTET